MHTLPATAQRRYDDWNALAVRLTPAERLLVYDVSEGWAPLCAFLGEPVPAAPFPHLNSTRFFRWVLALLSCLACLRCRASAEAAPSRAAAAPRRDAADARTVRFADARAR